MGVVIPVIVFIIHHELTDRRDKVSIIYLQFLPKIERGKVYFSVENVMKKNMIFM